jgi:hypothetical protein
MDKKLTIEQIKKAYRNYIDSHWVKPEDMSNESGLLAPKLWSLKPAEHSLESFTDKCNLDYSFYKKYTQNYIKPPIFKVKNKQELIKKWEETTLLDGLNSIGSNDNMKIFEPNKKQTIGGEKSDLSVD